MVNSHDTMHVEDKKAFGKKLSRTGVMLHWWELEIQSTYPCANQVPNYKDWEIEGESLTFVDTALRLRSHDATHQRRQRIMIRGIYAPTIEDNQLQRSRCHRR